MLVFGSEHIRLQVLPQHITIASISGLTERFSIKEQEQMVILIMEQGSYTVNGTTFNYSDTTLNLGQIGAVELGTGTYTPAAGTITGNWQNIGGSLTGTFSVIKSE